MAPPDRRVEVAVVGGGLTGLLTATLLDHAGLDVVVLERHGVGGVTSRGSTGKLTALQGARSSAIAQDRGPEAAAQYASAALSGVVGLRSLIRDMGIDCSLTSAPDLTYTTEPGGVAACLAELEAATAAGLPVEWVEDCELPFSIRGGVLLRDQAHLDPGALCAGLAAQMPPERVITGWPVLHVDEQVDGVELRGPDDARMRAEHVILATLGPIHDPALLATRCSASRSYGIAATHPSPPPITAISLDEPARSIRPGGAAGGTGVIVVGEGHRIGEDHGRLDEDRWSALEGFARNALGAGDVTHRWVAHDLMPSDGVPFIGRAGPGRDRVWVASGFQKWGISTAFVAADLFLDELRGSPPPWAPLFDPRRIVASATTELARTAARSAKHLLGDRVSDIVARRERRPRCTHLGCVLTFDDQERTWDCPCHGSRFDEAGQVVSGPAVRPLHID
ncbi:MAG: FAD-dependent oxidoreductase [Acidimicrobiales bacterium]